MSDEDRPYFESVARDMSRFPAYTDRLQQGVLNTLLLGRAMANPKGLASSSAFKAPDGSPLFDSGRIYYDSDGMGGNFGAVATAMAPDWDRAVLGTAGMRYSLISQRSTAFDRFNELLLQSYSGRIQRMVVLALAQTLWDRGEADGYAARITGDPPPNTPIHDVLIQAALGDHQTPQISSEILARTAETSVRDPAYDPGRYTDKIPFYGFNPAPRLELGSSLTMWDSGPIRAGGLGTDLAPVADAESLRRRPARARRRDAGGADPEVRVPSADGPHARRMPGRARCRTDSFPY